MAMDSHPLSLDSADNQHPDAGVRFHVPRNQHPGEGFLRQLRKSSGIVLPTSKHPDEGSFDKLRTGPVPRFRANNEKRNS